MEKFNPMIFTQDQWYQNNQKLYRQSDMLREEWKKRQEEAKKMVREKMLQTFSIQSGTTQQLTDRARDIYKWKKDLTQQLQDTTTEIRRLTEQKKRLENVLDTIELQLMIIHECLELRRQRKASDLVEDNVQQALKKEEASIHHIQKQVQQSLLEAEAQMKTIMDAKLALEKDWSDKSEAYEIDSSCGHMQNSAVSEIQPYRYSHGTEESPPRWSTPDSWLQYTKENIGKAKREQEISTRMRSHIDNFLKDAARELRLQADSVESAFLLRISESEDANFKLKNHIKQITDEIVKAEKLASELKQTIAEHSGPVKVVQTRLTKRTHRPNVELCRDPVQTGLNEELFLLNNTIKSFQEQLLHVEDVLEKLQETRKFLQDEVEVKQNSITIDKERCRPVRERFPAQRKLLGY